MDNSQKIHASKLQDWVKKYDISGICKDSKPTQKTIELAQGSDVVLTSSLKRTQLSAKMLSLNIDEENSLFNEAKIPKIDIPFLKLPPMRWLLIIRVLSFFSFGKIGLSLKESKLQAQQASLKLLVFSNKYNKVLLFGHGGMNWLIRKELLKDGWRLKEKPSNKNWGTTILVK